MRCPFCGTENAPDSRFCGGCGRGLAVPAPAPRIAPTAKIPDDAPIAPSTRSGPPSAQHPHVSYAPPAMPAPTPPPGGMQNVHIPTPPPGGIPPTPITTQRPPTQGPPAYDPGGPARRPMASNAAMAGASGSAFAAPPSRPLGLIALVLIVDLALAGTGTFLLAKGLSKSTDAVEKSSKP